MDYGGPSVEQLIARLQKCYDDEIDSKLLNIYVGGSRVYGTAREDSDWDFFAVTTVPTKRKFFPEDDGKTEEERQNEAFHPDLPFPPSMNLDVYEDAEMNFDMSFMSMEHFTILLREHRMAVLEALYVPKPFLLVERHKFEFEIDLDVLRKGISWSASLKFDVGKRRLGEGRVLKCKKLIWLSYRYFIYAMQLIEKGVIYDYQAANPDWLTVLNSTASTWEEFEEQFRSRFKELEAKFKAMRQYNDFYYKDEIETVLWPEFKRHPRVGTNPSPIGVKVDKEHPYATINYLREKGLDALVKEFSLLTCRHNKYPNLIELSPAAFSPKKESKIVRECNGLIVDENENFKVVAVPYETFFDWAVMKDIVKIDTTDYTVYEKLDGHFCMMYYYNNEWQIASTRIPDGTDPVCFKSLTGDVGPRIGLAEKFWNVWNEKGYSLPKDSTLCYMFEFLCPDFRKVSYTETHRIVLHGARNVENLNEVTPEPLAEANGWDCVKSFPELKGDWEKLLARKEELNPFVLPGFVVVDKNFARVKLLSTQYIAASSSLGFQNTGFGPFNLGAENFDWECLVEQVRLNKEEEFLFYFPRWAERMEDAKQKYLAYIAVVDGQYSPLRDVSEQRDVAKVIGSMKGVDKSTKAMFFEIKKEEVQDLRDYYARQPRARVIKLLKAYLDSLKTTTGENTKKRNTNKNK